MKLSFILPLFVFIVSTNSQGVAYWQQLVSLPSGLQNQNGYTYLKSSTMKSLFGNPCALTQDCRTVSSPTLSSQIETRRIGKFAFTGMRKALDALSRALNRVAAENPDLYNALGSSGMLCCRAIRGSTTTFSNHAWGAAIDFNVGGVLDPRGDAKAQRGLLALWPYMQREGFYWAAGYSGSSEDAMHFEIANEVMLNWGGSGDWGTCKTTTGIDGRCIDTSQCTGQTQSGRCPGPANIRCCYGAASQKRYKCVTASSLFVRSGPCTTYSDLTTAERNEVLEVVSDTLQTGCSNTWAHIRVRRNGVTGYVSTTYAVDCIPTAANEFNNTLVDEFLNGTIFAEDEGFDYESVEGQEETSMSSILAPFMIVPLFFVVELISKYVF